VLVFEDIHWADEGLMDFLDHLADWATEVPIVLLCTARPEILERRVGWGARANAATIAVPPLNPAETGALVGYLLKQPLVPAELQSALLERAEGNPLYAEEFIRMLVDRGFLYRDHGGWQLGEGDLPLPESVQGIVAARLDALEPDEKTLLRDASVIGRGFWPAAVSFVSGLDRETVDAALFNLERKELVRRVSASAIQSEQQYSFHHAVVRDVAYSSIPRVERSGKHRQAAEWIESLGRREDHAETIAHHYLSALEFARASGQPTEAFAERARDALRAAGERALALNSPGGAARFFSEALDLTAEDDPEWPDLLLLDAKSLYRTGHPDEELLEKARVRSSSRATSSRLLSARRSSATSAGGAATATPRSSSSSRRSRVSPSLRTRGRMRSPSSRGCGTRRASRRPLSRSAWRRSRSPTSSGSARSACRR
jgi:predicted ATPase